MPQSEKAEMKLVFVIRWRLIGGPLETEQVAKDNPVPWGVVGKSGAVRKSNHASLRWPAFQMAAASRCASR